MIHTKQSIVLGLAVYRWGAREQSDLLVDCLGPAIKELRDGGLVGGFRFDRFDTRGPHIAAVLTILRGCSSKVVDQLSSRLESYLAAHPSQMRTNAEEIERRHAECRGKVQFEADVCAEWAENDSFRFFEHDPQTYFLSPSLGVAAQAELWSLLDDLAFWAISRLRRQPRSAAVAWCALCDRSLRPRAEPAAYWRYHSTTLLLGLDRLLDADEHKIIANLPAMILPRNFELFSKLWPEVEGDPAPWPHLDRLMELVLRDPDRPDHGWWLLREIIHSTLKQLEVAVASQIPLILFAWQRNLPITEPSLVNDRAI
jgi:hypothetical protein